MQIKNVYKAYIEKLTEPTLDGNHREIFMKVLKEHNALHLLHMNTPNVELPTYLTRKVRTGQDL